jgi:hypothetical protein
LKQFFYYCSRQNIFNAAHAPRDRKLSILRKTNQRSDVTLFASTTGDQESSRIKHTCTDLPEHMAEVHSYLMRTGDEELTESKPEDR